MALSSLHDEDHWRRRAEEMRALASAVMDLTSKQTMLEIARGYERLAERAQVLSVFPKPNATETR
jgi:hypothetical protein